MQICTFENLRALKGPILITGHTGFKGTWLVGLLNNLKLETVGISLPAVKDSLYGKVGARPNREYFLDIRNRESIEKAILEIEPCIVIHLAAQPLVLESYKSPIESFDTNVMGTAHILNAAIKSKNCKAIAVITTDKVYRNEETSRKFVEDDPLAGKDPYSASKVATEAVVSAWQRISKLNHGPKIVSFRAGNVIGGGDFAPHRLLADYVRAQFQATNLEIRNPHSTRPWQHVLDPLYGYLLGLDYLLAGKDFQAINYGPLEKSLSVAEVIRIAESVWPLENSEVIFVKSEQELESLTLELDSSLAHSLLKWNPKWTQAEAASSTLKWWKDVSEGICSPEQAMERDILFRISE